MATYTVGAGNYIRPVRNNKFRTYNEAASQSFRVGDLLILQTTADKGHQVKVSGADPSAGTVIGVAMQAASGTENNPVVVAMFDEQGEFLVHVQDTGTIDNDDIGDEYGFVADATNLIHRLDLTETTAKVFRIIDFGVNPQTGAKFAHGDVNGAWIVRPAYAVQAVMKS